MYSRGFGRESSPVTGSSILLFYLLFRILDDEQVYEPSNTKCIVLSSEPLTIRRVAVTEIDTQL